MSNANKSDLIDEMLRTAKTIAVVGMSNKPWRASFNIGGYLAKHGYRVVAVNPTLSEIAVDGKVLTSYSTLEDAQVALAIEGVKIDLVDVFRAPEHVPAIVEDVIRLHIPYLWLQDEVIHDEAVEKAEAAGVKAIQNDCIFREHAARGW
ncbi:CoA-binding protein [Acidicapsa dinghuensis]|uniref:CoA-binding protein n=1 Tax=Acidicapsa dinghuensis TaxID=2218256 RepID=A0ABW1EKK7_9BACT|nr:CoA-binding protein [Acidicapsa dinghuensis]